jgi:ZIP family zinc transporter
MNYLVIIGMLLPLVGTSLGAGCVLLLKNGLSERMQRAFLGFAAGVMIAASVFSLLLPAIEMSREVRPGAEWVPAVSGFLAGVGFLLLLDGLIPHLHRGGKPEGVKTSLSKRAMLALAVTLHNIPEGMAVGVVLAGAAYGHGDVTIAAALALSVGIAVQNIPEGAVISMPMRAAGASRARAFAYGFLSGAVEPVGAAVTVFAASFISGLLPYVLSFAAGAMIYVVVEELIPESQQDEHSNVGTIGAALGFALMMALDVALG